MLYECLAGGSPFQGESLAETLSNILHCEPDLARFAARNAASDPRLDKDLRNRIHHISDARLEIEEALSQPQFGVPASPSDVNDRWTPLAKLLAVVVVMAVALRVVYALSNRQLPIASIEQRLRPFASQ